MSMLQIGVAAFMLFLGCTALSATGFGIGMVAMPGLLFVLEPQTAVVVLNTIALALEAWISCTSSKRHTLREVLPIAVAGALGGAVCGVHSEICRSRHNAYRHIRTRLDVGSDRDVQLPERIPVLEGSRRTGWTCGGGCASRIWSWRPLGDSLSPDAELAKRICQSGNGILPALCWTCSA